MSVPATADDPALAAAERRERLGLAALSLPALVFVALFLFVPIGALFWQSFVTPSGSFTGAHYQRLLDSPSLHNTLIATFEIGLIVTVACLLLGYPIAYFLSQLPRRAANLLMLLVVIPYWTSILVRTYAWLVLLQRNGIVNNALIGIGVIDEPLRLSHNFLGVIIGMVHIMVPFFVLPVYSTMQQIDRNLLRAAATLGSSPTHRFWTVFFPLSLPGVVAGAFLVFVLCLGFYVTPAILGGGRVQIVAQAIESSISLYASWGAASAIGVVLLAITLSFLGLAALITRAWQARR